MLSQKVLYVYVILLAIMGGLMGGDQAFRYICHMASSKNILHPTRRNNSRHVIEHSLQNHSCALRSVEPHLHGSIVCCNGP